MKFLKTANTLSKVLRSLDSTTVLRLLLAACVLFFIPQAIVSAQTTDEPPDPSAQLVHIPDPVLREALEKALGKSAGADITQAEMATLTKVVAQKKGVRDLTGLEYATHLRFLYLSGNVITDVSPLQTLTRLMWLVLTNNQIVDVSPLAQLTSLQWLELDHNQIVDVSPLQTLPRLHSLELRSNRISDVSPLAQLKTDLCLYLSGNPVSDFSVLSELNLWDYDFDIEPEDVPEGIDIPDPRLRKDLEVALRAETGLSKKIGSPITQADMESLRTLHLPYGLHDPTGLEYATNLTELSIADSNTLDLEPLVRVLRNLENLRTLSISNIKISDVSPLKHLTQLRKLVLDRVGISDVSPLQHLTNLSELILSSNDISDVSPLKHLTNLTRLSLYNNRITDFSPIDDLLSQMPDHSYYSDLRHQKHTLVVKIPDAGLRAAIESALSKEAGDPITEVEMASLTSLDASRRAIRDLTGLEYATHLTALNLMDNQIVDVSFLQWLNRLTRLELAGNAILDVQFLDDLRQLTHLDLSRNRIVNVSPLNSLTQLKTLNVASNEISYVWSLETLSSLTTLDLAKNNVADVSPLAGLTNLKKLYLRDNPANDFSSLYELIPNLDDADFSYQAVETEQPDPQQAPGDETLQGIAIPDANLRRVLEAALGKSAGDIITQAEMETLRKLNARRAGIADLTGLEYAINLRQLDLRRNKISDVSPLSGLTQLKRLYLSRNRISDFSSIAGVTDDLSKYNNGRQKSEQKSKQVPVNADVNRDNVVDRTDLDIVSRYTGRQLSSVESGLYPDVNGDGKIDTKDVLAVTERLPLGPVSGTGQ